MVIAAVCQPLAARPPNRRGLCRGVVEVEGLRIELSGKRLDLRFIDGVRGAGEAPADLEVLEIEPMIVALKLAWFRHGPPPPRI